MAGRGPAGHRLPAGCRGRLPALSGPGRTHRLSRRLVGAGPLPGTRPGLALGHPDHLDVRSSGLAPPSPALVRRPVACLTGHPADGPPPVPPRPGHPCLGRPAGVALAARDRGPDAGGAAAQHLLSGDRAGDRAGSRAAGRGGASLRTALEPCGGGLGRPEPGLPRPFQGHRAARRSRGRVLTCALSPSSRPPTTRPSQSGRWTHGPSSGSPW